MKEKAQKVKIKVVPSEYTMAHTKEESTDPLDVKVSDVRPRYPGANSSEEPTPYEQSALAQSDLAKEVKDDPDSLYNARDPYYEIKHEKPEHRSIIFLKASGLPNCEIATKLGLSPVTVSNVVRQPWAQARILAEIHRAGRDEVATLLGTGADAILRLQAEMDNENARPSERIQAADKLLDRIFGKPNQPYTKRTEIRLDELSDEELAKIATS